MTRQRVAIAEAARELHLLREGWLGPEGLDEDELKLRTLTDRLRSGQR
jgi:hypothetical protein